MNYESTIAGEDIEPLDDGEGYDQKQRRLIIAAIAVVILVLAGLAFWYFSSSGGAAGSAADQANSQAPAVTVAAPGSQNVVNMISATGTLAARRDIPVGVTGEGGRVTNVYVDAGDWVKPGQIMASIDRSVQNQQVVSLKASASAARANLNLAQANLDRAAQLIERGFISKADIDRLTATRDSSSAQLRVSQAQLAEARARNSRLNIVAPKGGFVLERNIEPGQTVTQGSGVVFRLAQNGEMELQARLSEGQLAQLSVGGRAEVIPVGTEQIFNGNIWQISPTVDENSRQGIAKIALSFDPALRPGGFASVRINGGAVAATVLPESAIQSDSKGDYVYIVGKENKVVRRDVETGLVTAEGVSITSGLTGNEQIVLFAGGFLNPGETIRPQVQKKTAEQAQAKS